MWKQAANDLAAVTNRTPEEALKISIAAAQSITPGDSMEYDWESLAFEHMLDGRTQDARYIIREHLDDQELIKLADALDKYAALVDEERIHRLPPRR